MISTPNESLIVSILSAGTFCGALLSAPMADTLGRRMGIIAACLVFSAGVAMQTAAVQVPLFVVGRVFAGLGVGMVSCLIPMYQAECSPKWIRGAVVSCYQWAIVGSSASFFFALPDIFAPDHRSSFGLHCQSVHQRPR